MADLSLTRTDFSGRNPEGRIILPTFTGFIRLRSRSTPVLRRLRTPRPSCKGFTGGFRGVGVSKIRGLILPGTAGNSSCLNWEFHFLRNSQPMRFFPSGFFKSIRLTHLSVYGRPYHRAMVIFRLFFCGFVRVPR